MSGSATSSAPETRRYTVGGRVQGVGFRPFVYRLATELGVRGWVRNASGPVEIMAQGPGPLLDCFRARLVDAAPPLARPAVVGEQAFPLPPLKRFRILPSRRGGEGDVHIPPDYFACADCRRELRDPADRRFQYPFINCTQCGPRYTLIDRLPYDRAGTSMAGFPLCADCRAEYDDPSDRRFHAEPVACPRCGPRLRFSDGREAVEEGEAALAAALALLRAGRILAVCGIGGYHLMCDARRESAVRTLRDRKRRPHKPLAVMLPEAGADGCDRLRRYCTPGETELRLLRDPLRPIVLCRKGGTEELAPGVAPGLGEVGVLLPYSPLHQLILDGLATPLVATSGNLSGEPVLTDPGEAQRRLGGIADGFLHHNRPIRRPADDSVYRVIDGRPRPLRLGRGVAPLELDLPFELDRPLLALGGHMKNAVALAWGRRVVISPHIGDLDSPRGLAVFEQVAEDLQRLYGVRAARLACDAHPGYASSRWARERDLPVTEVYHHHAHAGAVAGEFAVCDRDILVFTWDGAGWGPDGTLWGGETLLGRPGRWRRVASFRSFRLPGGDQAGREPWRAAAALCWQTGREPPDLPEGADLARRAWERDLNCPASSAAGRLFDAAAALTGLCGHASFEGHGPMLLEAAADAAVPSTSLPLTGAADGCLRADWEPLLDEIADRRRGVGRRAGRFHDVLAATLCAVALRLRRETGCATVGLAGGVFQNRRLAETASALLRGAGFEVLLPRALPCNDAGIGFGQVIEAGSVSPRRRGS